MNKTTLTKPQLKPKQTEILKLLYRFRFLNRIQIQKIFNHKNHHQIQLWLNDLITQKYINKSFERKIAAAPAVYCLGTNGRKYLKNNLNNGEVEPALLDRVWREKNYSAQFKEHCLFLAEVYLSLVSLLDETETNFHFYTKTDLSSMEHLISPNPDAYFSYRETNNTVKRYFLDILDDLPSRVLRKRIRQYFYYYSSDEWTDNTDKPFPEILLICPNDKTKWHLFYYIRKKLADEPKVRFYLTTRSLVISRGLNRDTLQKVMAEE